ncbi:hypothetical protein ACFWN1_16980 [Streptomyces sp. NPDC058459]|uniref:hypothetical protein n=1 Tax=Streptomyces sp. NPDC058459 TaxID=3346508 RepID=UPI003656D035
MSESEPHVAGGPRRAGRLPFPPFDETGQLTLLFVPHSCLRPAFLSAAPGKIIDVISGDRTFSVTKSIIAGL